MNQRGWNKMKTNNKIDLVTFFRRKQPPHTLQKILFEFLISVMLKFRNFHIVLERRSKLDGAWNFFKKNEINISLSVLAVLECVHSSSDSENNFSSLNLRRSSWLGSVDRVINANIRKKNKASAFAALEMVMMNLKWNPFLHFSHDMHFNFSLPLQAHSYVRWLNSQLGCDS